MKTQIKCLDCGIFSTKCDRCPVCGRSNVLDNLTSQVTAFDSWAEFVASMSGGYVPTIRPDSKAKRELAAAVREAGFRVFDGKQVA